MEDSEKTYSPEEVAKTVLKKALDMYKNSDLCKSNSAHEVEAGGEPSNDDAECPEYLANADMTTSKTREDSSGSSDSSTPSAESSEDDEEDEGEKKKKKEEEGDDDEAKAGGAEEEGDSEMFKDSDKIVEDAAKENDKEKEMEKSEVAKTMTNDMYGAPVAKKDNKLKEFLKRKKNRKMEKTLGIQSKDRIQGKEGKLPQQKLPEKSTGMKGY